MRDAWCLPLAALALRRTLAPGVLLWCALAALLAATTDWAPPAAWGGAQTSAAGLAREGWWSVFALLVAPLLLVRAAALAPVWNARERAWSGNRALEPAAQLRSVLAGCLAALLLACAAWALLAEARAGGGEALEPAGSLECPGGRWVGGGEALVWRAAAREARFAPGTRARIELGLGSGAGIAARARLRATRGDGVNEATAVVDNRGAVEVELPSGEGALVLELALLEPQARALVLSRAVELWQPAAGARLSGLRLALRCAGLLALCAALALAASAWASGGTAALAAALAALGALAFAPDSWHSWIPGADLPAALALCGQGRVPAPLAPQAWALLALVLALALLTGAHGPRLRAGGAA